MRSVLKCDKHMRAYRDPSTLDEAYYAELGLLDGGKLRATKHVDELAEALGPFPEPTGNGLALEIGCGVSPYCLAMQDAGWVYRGMDLSDWAIGWMIDQYDVEAYSGDWESGVWPFSSFILAAHCLEHMRDSPKALKKMADSLLPGGHLWLIVPDDGDPTNPDHLWFFTEATLDIAIFRAGLVLNKIVTYQRVPHEKFIYARAKKPF